MSVPAAVLPWSLRRLEPGDVAAYRALRLAALRESPAAYGSSAEEEEALPMAAFDARLAPAADRAVFGAFDGTTLVALAGLVREAQAKRAHIATVFGVYVAPQARGRGVGRGMMQFTIERARALPGLRQLRLAVNADNTAALNLYTSLGFVSFGRERDAVAVDGRFHDELHMALRWQPADPGA
jgi:ribosomal protein S18 acetylase RimI-like enzyme